MKSYIQGLITGGVLVFALFVLMGSTNNDSEVGRYAISTVMNGAYIAETIIDTKTGEVISRTQRLGTLKIFKKIKK